MEWGKGICIIENRKYEGEIVLDTKLYLKDKEGNEIYETLIPLEKIEYMKLHRNKLELRVFPSFISSYTAFIFLNRKKLKKLAKTISERTGMKKKFLLNEWHGDIYLR